MPIDDLGEMYVPADIPEAAQEAMAKQLVTDWVNSRRRTEDGDMPMFAESSADTYIDGARLPEDMLASRAEVGRDENDDLPEKTTLRRHLQAGAPWLFTDTVSLDTPCATPLSMPHPGSVSVIRC